MSTRLFNTIVVATDGSATAAHAIARGAELAGLTGGDLELVGAYESAKDQAPLEAALAEAATEARKTGLTVTTVARAGDPVDVILAVAEEHKADLIVVGNLGMTGAKRYLLGSIPDKISHRAHCSVLVAHTTGH